MRLQKLPKILLIHLKRFKFVEEANRYVKLCHRVVFPLELRIPPSEAMYSLLAVVLHHGGTATAGHYVCFIRSKDRWLLFDDDNVRPVEVDVMLQYSFGIILTCTTCWIFN